MSMPQLSRALLRQDPDVILFGEIRDHEMGDLALMASETGHVVLSTLHTSDALGSVVRLRGLDLEDADISNSLLGVVAQRLVRKVCLHCLEATLPTDTQAAMLGELLDGLHFFEGRGCERCNGTGYRGRVGIYELLLVDEGLQDMIADKAHKSVLRRYIMGNGFRTMVDDALSKVNAGLTTVDELLRVLPYRQLVLARQDLLASRDRIVRKRIARQQAHAAQVQATQAQFSQTQTTQGQTSQTPEPHPVVPLPQLHQTGQHIAATSQEQSHPAPTGTQTAIPPTSVPEPIIEPSLDLADLSTTGPATEEHRPTPPHTEDQADAPKSPPTNPEPPSQENKVPLATSRVNYVSVKPLKGDNTLDLQIDVSSQGEIRAFGFGGGLQVEQDEPAPWIDPEREAAFEHHSEISLETRTTGEIKALDDSPKGEEDKEH